MHHSSAIQTRRPPGGKLFEYCLAGAIFAGSLVMWLGIPLGCLWLVSLATENVGTFLILLLVVCPLAMIAFAVLLAKLNEVYLRVTGAHPAQGRAAWLKSLSGESRPRRPPAVLDVSMTISALIALVAMLIFFFFFAESYMPAPIAP
jgi:hypothetical protein